MPPSEGGRSSKDGCTRGVRLGPRYVLGFGELPTQPRNRGRHNAGADGRYSTRVNLEASEVDRTMVQRLTPRSVTAEKRPSACAGTSWASRAWWAGRLCEQGGLGLSKGRSRCRPCCHVTTSLKLGWVVLKEVASQLVSLSQLMELNVLLRHRSVQSSRSSRLSREGVAKLSAGRRYRDAYFGFIRNGDGNSSSSVYL